MGQNISVTYLQIGVYMPESPPIHHLYHTISHNINKGHYEGAPGMLSNNPRHFVLESYWVSVGGEIRYELFHFPFSHICSFVFHVRAKHFAYSLVGRIMGLNVKKAGTSY